MFIRKRVPASALGPRLQRPAELLCGLAQLGSVLLVELTARGERFRELVTEGDHRLLGIFTGRDAVHRVLAEGKSAARTKLAEVMTPEPNTMPPGKTAIEALRLMEDGRYRHVPVVDGGRVVGIVSRFDFSGIELDRLDEETGLWERI